MAIECDPVVISDSLGCWNTLPVLTLKAIQIVLLCDWINGETVECDPAALAERANCFVMLSKGQIEAILTYLWCQVANL